MIKRFTCLISLTLTTTFSFAGEIRAQSWDPVKIITGRSTGEQLKRTVNKLERAATLFTKDPLDYVLSRPASLVADVCAAVPRTYEGVLRGRATQWHSLPPLLISAVQSQYAVDLTTVSYTLNANTVDGSAQVFGNSIYFPQTIDLRNRSDLHWMLHELEHVVQYAHATYGKSGKLCEYIAKGIGSGLDHDAIDMERAADMKAAYLINYAHGVMIGNIVPFTYGPIAVVKPNEIWIHNATLQSVSFVLQSRSMIDEVVLPSRASQIFRAGPADTWFNITIRAASGDIAYGLTGGTRQHIDTDPTGAVGIYHEPPHNALEAILRLRSYNRFDSANTSMEEAERILRAVGLTPGEPRGPDYVSARIADGFKVTIWVNSHNRNVYGIRWGADDGRYSGSEDTYFEIGVRR